MVLLICSFVFAQEKFALTVTKEITKKAGGEITVTGKTFDELWSGMTKALMLLKFRVTEANKDSKQIFAQKRAGLFANDYDADETPNWQILIEEEDGKFKVSCFFQSYAGARIYSVKKPFKKLCTKLKETLSD
jgi:hypothetical protein